MKDLEIVKGQGNYIDAYYNFGNSEMITIVNIQKTCSRGYQGFPKEKVAYSLILEPDNYLVNIVNSKELSGQFMTTIKRFTIFDEAKRMASNSKLKGPQSTTSQSKTQSTTGWGNTSQTPSGWGTSTPFPAWWSPQRPESDSWSQFTGPLLNVPNYQFQMSQGQIN